MSLSAPQDSQLKAERTVFGFHRVVLLKDDTLEQSAADHICMADQISQQVVGSNRLSILIEKCFCQ